ncbi:unnamed protein product [Schistosoma mattheei]|uniref:Uncharacterized protein n=1 Tax=Schistosoma mattheei TaxID=31246 RepID=A0A3P8DVY2_9TREM|nr:unnamed protein product [Schistosoma mattheei]
MFHLQFVVVVVIGLQALAVKEIVVLNYSIFQVIH